MTEWDEPQAVIGSYLHRYAYPDWFAAHEKRGRRLQHGAQPRRAGAAACLQLRGEYLYVAEGRGGMRVYDVASIAQQGHLAADHHRAVLAARARHARRHRANATCVALPTNQPIAPAAQPGRHDARRQPGAAVPSDLQLRDVTDAEEGLILVDVNTLADGEPRNNFLKRALTWNADGVLERRAPHHARRPLRLHRDAARAW